MSRRRNLRRNVGLKSDAHHLRLNHPPPSTRAITPDAGGISSPSQTRPPDGTSPSPASPPRSPPKAKQSTPLAPTRSYLRSPHPTRRGGGCSSRRAMASRGPSTRLQPACLPAARRPSDPTVRGRRGSQLCYCCAITRRGRPPPRTQTRTLIQRVGLTISLNITPTQILPLTRNQTPNPNPNHNPDPTHDLEHILQPK